MDNKSPEILLKELLDNLTYTVVSNTGGTIAAKGAEIMLQPEFRGIIDKPSLSKTVQGVNTLGEGVGRIAPESLLVSLKQTTTKPSKATESIKRMLLEISLKKAPIKSAIDKAVGVDKYVVVSPQCIFISDSMLTLMRQYGKRVSVHVSQESDRLFLGVHDNSDAEELRNEIKLDNLLPGFLPNKEVYTFNTWYITDVPGYCDIPLFSFNAFNLNSGQYEAIFGSTKDFREYTNKGRGKNRQIIMKENEMALHGKPTLKEVLEEEEGLIEE